MAKLQKLRCPTCGGNVIDDPADERTYCLQCGRGVDYIRSYVAFTTRGEGKPTDTTNRTVKVMGAAIDTAMFYEKHPLR